MSAAIWTAIISFWRAHLLLLVQLPFAGICATLVVLVCLLISEASGRWMGFWGLRYPWSYPPLWCAAILGTAIALWVVALTLNLPPDTQAVAKVLRSASVLMVLGSASVLTLAWMLGEVAASIRTRAGDEEQTSTSPQLVDYRSTVQWIRDDRAVEEPGQDRFELAAVAKRAARRLADRAGSQLVVGAMGSGKTSLRNLTRWYLARIAGGERIRVVPVELWQYETARAAVAGIIRALAQELGAHVNVVSVTGVSSQYLASMSESGGLGSGVAKLIHRDEDPYESLDAIDGAASAINIHLVVWLEDIERFLDGGVSSAGHDGAPDSAREAEVLNPVRALVHGLDRLTHVSVVTATTSLVRRFDTEKLARFVEDVPHINAGQVTELLIKFRKGLAADHSDDISPVQGTELDTLENPYWSWREANRQSRNAAEALLHFFDTPRKLKQALRLTYELWAKLHGEIDRDDLILMAGLKVSSPRGFSLIRDHYDELQRLRLPENQRGEQNFSRALDTLGLTRERQDVWTVAQSIFNRGGGAPRPQGLHVERYWRRFLAEDQPVPGDRDQAVLRAIRDQDDAVLVDFLVNDQGPLVENFDHLIPDDVAFRLLVPVCDRLVMVNPSIWETEELFGGQAPGILNLWRTWLEKLRNAPRDTLDRTLEIVVGELLVALPRTVGNIGLLRDLEYYYLSRGREQPLVLYIGGEERGRALAAQVHKALSEALVAHYAGRPGVLADAVRPARPFSLWRVVWGSDRCEEKRFEGVPFSGWSELASTLLHAGQSDQDTLAELAVFVVREAGRRVDRQGASQIFEYDRELCVRLFGSEDVVFSLPWNSLPKKTRTSGCVDAVRQAVLDAAWARRLEEGWE